MQLVPFIVSLALRQMTVQNGHRVRLRGEAALESLDCLRGQRDFRDEYDRRLAPCERGSNCLQINFRFSASGHAVEENRPVRFRIFERSFD